MQTLLDWLSLAAAIALLVFLVWRYIKVVCSRPHFGPSDVLFQEWFASGYSQKNFLTKVGGGRNFLRFVVTANFSWVTTWFPFSLIASLYDMEHVISLNAIKSVKRDRFWGTLTFLVIFTNEAGQSRTLRLISKKPDRFAQSLESKVA
jgi:hypothetical protein